MTELILQGATDTKDAHIRSEATSTNYGSLAYVSTGFADGGGGLIRTWLWFDLSSIPSSAIITSVSLEMQLLGANAGANTLSFYKCLRNPVESQITWNIYSTGNNWGSAGADQTGTDRLASADFSEVIDTTTETKTFMPDNADIQAWTDGTYTNYGWILQSTEVEGNVRDWASSENSTSSYHPKLIINYVGYDSGSLYY